MIVHNHAIIGERVTLQPGYNNYVYISRREKYTNMYVGKIGTIIGVASTGKIAVEFDDKVFTKYDTQLSSHDNGCHGKGKLHYCWYIPEDVLEYKYYPDGSIINDGYHPDEKDDEVIEHKLTKGNSNNADINAIVEALFTDQEIDRIMWLLC